MDLLSDHFCVFLRNAFHPHSPALASRRGIGEYPPLSASSGSGSSSPWGRGSDHDITPLGQGVHLAEARKHPVTEQREVAVLTSVSGPESRKWAGKDRLGTSGSESWRPRREAVGGKPMKKRFLQW